MAEQNYYGVGRRKSASARVYLARGAGRIEVNGKTLEDYFGRDTSRMVTRQALGLLDATEQLESVVLPLDDPPTAIKKRVAARPRPESR